MSLQRWHHLPKSPIQRAWIGASGEFVRGCSSQGPQVSQHTLRARLDRGNGGVESRIDIVEWFTVPRVTAREPCRAQAAKPVEKSGKAAETAGTTCGRVELDAGGRCVPREELVARKQPPFAWFDEYDGPWCVSGEMPPFKGATQENLRVRLRNERVVAESGGMTPMRPCGWVPFDALPPFRLCAPPLESCSQRHSHFRRRTTVLDEVDEHLPAVSRGNELANEVGIEWMEADRHHASTPACAKSGVVGVAMGDGNGADIGNVGAQCLPSAREVGASIDKDVPTWCGDQVHAVVT